MITMPIRGDLLATLREENLNVYRASPQRLREDVGQENPIAQDYRGRLIYELLQNADDAMTTEDSGVACVRFVLTDEALWVGNSGRPLDAADVRGLCGLSASSKVGLGQKRRATIGHKGMGFKSVLEITDAPEVYLLQVRPGRGAACRVWPSRLWRGRSCHTCASHAVSVASCSDAT